VRPLALLLTLALPCSAQVTFVDVVGPTGTDSISFGRASATADFDDDGRLDLFAANALTPSQLFRQLADGVFVDVSDAWNLPLAGDDATFTALATDFDNDGDPDLYLGNGGFIYFEDNEVLRNDLDTLGVFTDVSAASGDGDLPDTNTFGSTALDYDNDGDIDVFMSRNGQGCDLLRNDGGLVFTEVSVEAGISAAPGQELSHVGTGDIDNDGWWDVGVGNRQGRNLLWHNQGDGTFLDIAGAAGVSTPDDNFGLAFEDFDNDGWMDVFVAKYQPWKITTTSRIFLNDGDLTFTDVSEGSGLTGQTDMGFNVNDVDNDGHGDVYIGTGHPQFESLDALFLVTPDGQGGVVADDVSQASGITSNGTTRCHGMAFGDYDEDGDVDVYVNNGGPQNFPQTLEENFFWLNEGNANGWLQVDLRGVVSPRDPVGARLVATTPSGREIRVHRAVGKGFGNTDAPTLQVGLAEEDEVERLDVLWPSGIEQVVVAPPAQTRVALVETGLRVLGVPALGQTADLQIVGQAGHAWTLYVAGASATFPLPKFGGDLQLVPPLLVLATGTLDEDGLSSLPLAVPDLPELEGLVVPMQAWIRPPPASQGGTLSNLVELAIGG